MDSKKLFENYTFKVDTNPTPIRIDKFLFDKMPNVTRNKIKEGVKQGVVKVNGNKVKPSYKVKPSDEVIASLSKEKKENDITPENIKLDIVYEDKELLVINKPSGMVVHPAYENWEGTLVNALVYHFRNLPQMKNNEGRPGLVHRIDKETSGLLVIAKTETAMASLSSQFLDHSIKRKYQALIWGIPKEREGTIEINLRRSLKDRRIIEGYPENTMGKKAITHYKVLETIHYLSLIECELETGRTHQIRAHMKHIGHPRSIFKSMRDILPFRCVIRHSKIAGLFKIFKNSSKPV